jgi:hypothetical protein
VTIIDTPQRLLSRHIEAIVPFAHKLDTVLVQENGQQGRELDLCEFAAQAGAEAG